MAELRQTLRDAATDPRPATLDLRTLGQRAQRLRRRRALALASAICALVVMITWVRLPLNLQPGARVELVAPPGPRSPDSLFQNWRSAPLPGLSGPSYVRTVAIGNGRAAVIAGADYEATRVRVVIVDVASATTTHVDTPLHWRANYLAAWTGTELLIIGGGSNQGAMGDGGAYNPATGDWRSVAPPPADAPIGQPGMLTDDRLVFFWDAGLAYDPADDSWTTLPAAPSPPGQDPAVAVSDDHLFVWGGCNPRTPQCDDVAGGDELSDGAVLNLHTGTWRPLPDGPLAPRDRPEAAWVADRFIVWGGHPTPGHPGSYAAAWNPATNKWKTINRGPLSLNPPKNFGEGR